MSSRESSTPVTVRQSNVGCGAAVGSLAGRTIKSIRYIQRACDEATVCIETRDSRDKYMAAFERRSSVRARFLREQATAGPAQTLFSVSVPFEGACDGRCGVSRMRSSFAASMGIPYASVQSAEWTAAEDGQARVCWRDKMVSEGEVGADVTTEETCALARCSACMVRGLWTSVQREYVACIYGSNRALRSIAPGPASFDEPAPPAPIGAGVRAGVPGARCEVCSSVSASTGVCLDCGRAEGAARAVLDVTEALHAPICVARCVACGVVAARQTMCPMAGCAAADGCAYGVSWHVPGEAAPSSSGHFACYSCALYGDGATCPGCLQELRPGHTPEQQQEFIEGVRAARSEAILLQPSLAERVDEAGRPALVLHVQILAHDMRDTNAKMERYLDAHREGQPRYRKPLLDATGCAVAASVWFQPEDQRKAPVNSKIVNIGSDPQRNLPAIEIKTRNQCRLGVSSGHWAPGGAGKQQYKTQPHCPLEHFCLSAVPAAVSSLIRACSGDELEMIYVVDNLHTIVQDTLPAASLRAIEAAVDADPDWSAASRLDELAGVAKQPVLNLKRLQAGALPTTTGANVKISLSTAEDGSSANVLLSFTGRKSKAEAFRYLWEVQALVRKACGAPPVPAGQRKSDCEAPERARVVAAARALLEDIRGAPTRRGSGAERLAQLTYAADSEYPTSTEAIAAHFAAHPGSGDTDYEIKYNQKQCSCCTVYNTRTLVQDKKSRKKKPASTRESSYCAACEDSAVCCVQARPNEQTQPMYFRHIHPKHTAAARRTDPEQNHMKEHAFKKSELPERFTDYIAAKIGPATTEAHVATIAANMGFLFEESEGARGENRLAISGKVCTKCYQKILNNTKVDSSGFVKTAQTKLTDEALSSQGDCLAAIAITEIGQAEHDKLQAGAGEAAKPSGEPALVLLSKKKRIENAVRVLTPYITVEQGGEDRAHFLTDPGLRALLDLLWIDWQTDDTGMRAFVQAEAARLARLVADVEQRVRASLLQVEQLERERDARVAHQYGGPGGGPTPAVPLFAPAAGTLQSVVSQMAAWAEGFLARATGRGGLPGLQPLPAVAAAAAAVERALAQARASAALADAYERSGAVVTDAVTPHAVCAFRRWLVDKRQIGSWFEASKLLRQHGTTFRKSNGLIKPPKLGTIRETLQAHNVDKPNTLINQCFRQLAQSKEKLDACGMGPLTAIAQQHHPMWRSVHAEEAAVSPLPRGSKLWSAQPNRTTWPVSGELEAMTSVAVAAALCLGCPGADLEDAWHLPLRSDDPDHIFPVQLRRVDKAELTHHGGRPQSPLSVMSEAVMRVFVGAPLTLHAKVGALVEHTCEVLQTVALQRRRSRHLATAQRSEERVFALLQASARDVQMAHFERTNELRTTMWSGQAYFRQNRYFTVEPIAVHIARYVLDCLTMEMHKRRTVFADRVRESTAGAKKVYGSQGVHTNSAAKMLDVQEEERRCHIYQQLGAQDEPSGQQSRAWFGQLLRSVAEQIQAPGDEQAALQFLRGGGGGGGGAAEAGRGQAERPRGQNHRQAARPRGKHKRRR